MHARRLVIVLLLALVSPALAQDFDYQPGDLIFIKIPTGFGRAIEDITASPASHVGLVARHASGHLTVVHALGKVQEEPIERYIDRGKGPYTVTRFPGLDAPEKQALVDASRKFLGWPYDREFLVDNEAMYCSELVYRAFADGLASVPVALSPMKFGTPGTSSYEVMKRITGGRIPEGKPGVSPGDYLESPLFEVLHDDLREKSQIMD